MVEEALSGPAPRADHHPGQIDKAQTSSERPSAAKKSASSTGVEKVESIAVDKADGKNFGKGKADKKQKLVSHLLIGFLMAVIAILGYTFLGPQARASAADPASNHLINVTTDVPFQAQGVSANGGYVQASDLAALQAEMDAITRQMDALRAENMPTGSTPDQMSAKLDQMTAMMNDLMRQMSTQTGGTGTSASGSGHGHH